MLRPFHTPDKIECGLDEAGRGCLAGPVVAAAVILPRSYSHPLLNDSKQLTAAQRLALREEITEVALAWAVAAVSNIEIDEINILKASFLAMHRALYQLNGAPELLLVDGNRFTPYPGIAHVCIVQGDALYASIAAASILAKTHRDELMQAHHAAHPHYSWHTNKGYPTPAHRAAIRQHGPCDLHRMTFQLLPPLTLAFGEAITEEG
jgi:ribonuclease HII